MASASAGVGGCISAGRLALAMVRESAMATITGAANIKKASLKAIDAPALELSGFKGRKSPPDLVLTIAMNTAVPRLPPRKNSIELMLRADASIGPLTRRHMVAARGVFMSPKPAPNIPVNPAMTQTGDPA
jgi:hypothetical protein